MIPVNVRIFVCIERVDMRCGFDRLALLAREKLQQDPRSGALRCCVMHAARPIFARTQLASWCKHLSNARVDTSGCSWCPLADNLWLSVLYVIDRDHEVECRRPLGSPEQRGSANAYDGRGQRRLITPFSYVALRAGSPRIHCSDEQVRW
jgi:hypothetical protein